MDRGEGGRGVGGDGTTWTIRAGSIPTAGSVPEDRVSPLDRACDLTLGTVGGRLTSQTGRMGATIKQSDYFFKESVDWVKGGFFLLFCFVF